MPPKQILRKLLPWFKDENNSLSVAKGVKKFLEDLVGKQDNDIYRGKRAGKLNSYIWKTESSRVSVYSNNNRACMHVYMCTC